MFIGGNDHLLPDDSEARLLFHKKMDEEPEDGGRSLVSQISKL